MSDVFAVAVNAGSTSVKTTSFASADDDGTTVTLAEALKGPIPQLVLHRVVHGGPRPQPVAVDDAVLAELRGLVDLAPLHQPPALDAIEQCRTQWPHARQIACFDTAFHADVPAAARTYALPGRLRDKVRGYGFHGLSYAWATRQVSAVAPEARRLLIAHLGGGQSLCAVREGRSVTTTMGFTPLDGLVMATRPGTLDPGALLWLARNTSEDLDAVLEHESGLLGLSDSADMRDVLTRADHGDADATLALEVWLHRFTYQAGGCVGVLGGIDALVFTGGIGENSAEIRARAAAALGWAGVHIDERRPTSQTGTDEITAAHASVRTFVTAAREDLQMLHESRSTG